MVYRQNYTVLNNFNLLELCCYRIGLIRGIFSNSYYIMGLFLRLVFTPSRGEFATFRSTANGRTASCQYYLLVVRYYWSIGLLCFEFRPS